MKFTQMVLALLDRIEALEVSKPNPTPADIQALVKAARYVLDHDGTSRSALEASVGLIEALKPFEVKS